MGLEHSDRQSGAVWAILRERRRKGGRQAGRQVFGVLSSWEKARSQIHLHFYFPEGPWDSFSPCAPWLPNHVGVRGAVPRVCKAAQVWVCRWCPTHRGWAGKQWTEEPKRCVWAWWRTGERLTVTFAMDNFGSVLQHGSFFPPSQRISPFFPLHIFHIIPSDPLIRGCGLYTCVLLCKTW